jgi:hypothetical protein
MLPNPLSIGADSCLIRRGGKDLGLVSDGGACRGEAGTTRRIGFEAAMTCAAREGTAEGTALA